MKRSYSQAGQDLFALEKASQRTYVDLGSSDPMFHNNSYLLDLKGWKGICIDRNSMWENEYNAKRSKKTTFLSCNATQSDYLALFGDQEFGSVIGYLSIDCDEDSLQTLLALPLSYSFEVITFEHDSYRLGSDVRDMSREFLRERGYRLVKRDVECDGVPFED